MVDRLILLVLLACTAGCTFLPRRSRARRPAPGEAETPRRKTGVTAMSFINALFVILLCLAGG